MNLPLARRRAAAVIFGLLVASLSGAAGCGRLIIDGVVTPKDGGACPSGELLCGATCVDLASDPAHCGHCDEACDQDDVCSHGDCTGACENGETACVGACVDLDKSSSHCGSCENACSSGDSCVKGSCN